MIAFTNGQEDCGGSPKELLVQEETTLMGEVTLR